VISPARAFIIAVAVWWIGVGSAMAQAPDTTATPAVEAQVPTDSTAAPPPESPAPPDTATVQVPADSTAAPPPVTHPLPADTTTFAPHDSIGRADIDPPKRDRDRFEIGVAKVEGGDFDMLGTLAYHRFLRKNQILEHWVHIELSGGAAEQITEIAASVAYLFRPVKGIKRSWPIQPIFEFGPGFHLVNQIADIEGFGENAFHTHAYLKAHAYAGLDVSLGAHLGLVTRARLTVPGHHAVDYAQIALFLR
jgi:hypothetical protein